LTDGGTHLGVPKPLKRAGNEEVKKEKKGGGGDFFDKGGDVLRGVLGKAWE